MFTTPFAKISKKNEKKLTFSIFYLLLITSVAMLYFDTYVTNEVTPNGIVSFELAKTLERSQAILDSWSPLAKIFAGIGLGFDFLFLLIYTLFISIIIHKLNVRLWADKPFYRVGEILIWTMFLTAIFDAIENVCLIKLLIGNLKQYWSTVAFYFSTAKFSLITISLLYIVTNFVLLLLKKRS